MCTSLLRQIAKSSFLSKSTTKGKEYCKMGHMLFHLQGKFCSTQKRDLPSFMQRKFSEMAYCGKEIRILLRPHVISLPQLQLKK
jgi:hypothetical protein